MQQNSRIHNRKKPKTKKVESNDDTPVQIGYN